jgi:hypothetical protein
MFRNKGICVALVIFLFTIVSSVYGIEAVLFEEDFEGLNLGPTINERIPRNDVWTDTPPDGWTIVDDLCDGMPEWNGWAFANGEWWMQTAENQNREPFVVNGKGIGTIAIADPDEWDDLGGPTGRCKFNSWLSTMPIDIASARENSLVLTFDSSWRPETTQDVELTVSFDGGDEVTIMTMESFGPNDGNVTKFVVPLEGIDEQIPDGMQVNETLEFEIPNPAGAKKMVITWGMIGADNDWWWAIDNISLKTTDFAVSAAGKLTSTWGSIKNQ